jgi:hypothetical protein
VSQTVVESLNRHVVLQIDLGGETDGESLPGDQFLLCVRQRSDECQKLGLARFQLGVVEPGAQVF